MIELNLSVVEGDDPLVRFVLKKDGAAVDLTNATVELILKDTAGQGDSDAGIVKYTVASGQITIVGAATGGTVDVQFSASDLAGTKTKRYRLRVLTNGRSLTYAHGVISKVDV